MLIFWCCQSNKLSCNSQKTKWTGHPSYKGNHKGCPYKDYVGAGLVPAQPLSERIWVQFVKCQHDLVKFEFFIVSSRVPSDENRLKIRPRLDWCLFSLQIRFASELRETMKTMKFLNGCKNACHFSNSQSPTPPTPNAYVLS